MGQVFTVNIELSGKRREEWKTIVPQALRKIAAQIENGTAIIDDPLALALEAEGLKRISKRRTVNDCPPSKEE